MVNTRGQLRQRRVVAVERAEVDGHEPGLPVVGVDDLRAASRPAAPRRAAPWPRARPGRRRRSARSCPSSRRRRCRRAARGRSSGRARGSRRARRTRRAPSIRAPSASRSPRGTRMLGTTTAASPGLTPRRPRYLGMQDAHVVPEGGERARQRARHVGEPARLGEGRGLGGHEQDAKPARPSQASHFLEDREHQRGDVRGDALEIGQDVEMDLRRLERLGQPAPQPAEVRLAQLALALADRAAAGRAPPGRGSGRWRRSPRWPARGSWRPWRGTR